VKQLFSSVSFEQLKTEISEDVFRKVANLIHSAQTAPKPQTEFVTRKEAAKLLGVSLTNNFGLD
jgi:hypothetical protein